jgi:ABC-type uncharacterized transport system involved in gliding motility auxiliary subunit
VVQSRQPRSVTGNGLWGRRSLQVSTNGLVATLAVLVILGLVNFLGARYASRVDLTENKIFTLAPETRQLVQKLKQPVKFWVFDPQPNPQDRELLTSYQRQSNQVSFEFVNPNFQPGLVQDFEMKNVGDVFLEVAPKQPKQRREFVQTVNQRDRLLESKLTNALDKVLSDRKFTAYFLQGHGEHPLDEGRGSLSQAVKALQAKSFDVQPLNLAQGGFPGNADVIVIAGAGSALFPPEIMALQDYLKQGGGVLLMIDPNTNPALDSLLNDWGVTVDDRVAVDASRRLGELGPAYVSVTQYGNHPITRDFGGNISFYPLARPVDVKSITGTQAVPLLFTSEKSWGERDVKTQPLKFDAKSDRPGPLALGYALTRPAVKPPVPGPTASPTASPSPQPVPSPALPQPAKESRLVVIGNSSFAINGAFDQAINGDVFLNAVRWLSQPESQEGFSIRPKESKNRRVTMSTQQAGLAGWTALGILPLLAFGTAFVVWWRRR